MVSNRVRKVVVTGAAVAAIGGISFGASAFASTSGAAHPAKAPAAAPLRQAAGSAPRVADHLGTPVRDTAPAVVSQLIGHGTVDGTPWSVTLEFHATLPKGFKAGTLPPGMPKQPERTSLLCQRMVVGGIRIDHQGGPWADCQPVDGAHDPSAAGEAGLWGLHDKGTTGSRLFVSNPGARVAYGVVTLTDGRRLTARVVAVPHTGYRAWAVAIPDGRTIASVDEFDAHHHRLSHQTEWR
ncbi:MAG TPA: hypothetical protein VGL02_07135 [Streptomyces sp.]